MALDIRWIGKVPHVRIITIEGDEESIGWRTSFELRQIADVLDGLQSPDDY